VVLECERLLSTGNYQADADILQYTVYFHGFIYNSKEEIIEWLKGQKHSKEMIDKVITAAWESQKDEAAQTLEGKILHDAHMIESGKTYLIVKSLITGSVKGQHWSKQLNISKIMYLVKEFAICQKLRRSIINSKNLQKVLLKT
jgi:uncharacterized protein